MAFHGSNLRQDVVTALELSVLGDDFVDIWVNVLETIRRDHAGTPADQLPDLIKQLFGAEVDRRA